MASFIVSAFSDEASVSLDEQIRALRENGLRYMEIRNVDGKNPTAMTAEELDALRRKLDENGISVSSIGSFIGKYNMDVDQNDVKKAVENAVRAAHILGARYIRLFSYFMKPEEYDRNRDTVMQRMQEITDYIRQNDIIPCHENESGIYGQNPDRVADLLLTVEGLRGVFDAANYIAHGCDVMEGFMATLPALEYIHVKDAIRKEDGGRYIMPCGEGEGHYAEIFDLVDKAIDGPVFLTVEPHLMEFAGYADMDKLELKGIHNYKNNMEAFAAAVSALHGTLETIGFKKGDNFVWKR